MPRTRALIAGAIAVAVLATVFTIAIRAVRGGVDAVRKAGASSVTPELPDPTRIERGKNLFEGRNFGRALAALRRREGDAAPLVKVQVYPYGLDFHIRRGEHEAFGYQWLANERKLRPVQVRIIGDGPMTDEDFPLELVREDAVRKLAARVREEGPAFEPRVLTLERVPPDAFLLWSAQAGDSDGGTVVWHTLPNGTGFATPERFAKRFRAK